MPLKTNNEFLYGRPDVKPEIAGLPEGGRIKVKYRTNDFARAFWSDGKIARMYFLQHVKGNHYRALEFSTNHHLKR